MIHELLSSLAILLYLWGCCLALGAALRFALNEQLDSKIIGVIVIVIILTAFSWVTVGVVLEKTANK